MSNKENPEKGKNILRSRLDKTSREILNFLSSVNEDQNLYEYDILGTEVHNIMLCFQDILSFDELHAIIKGLEEVKREKAEYIHQISSTVFEDIHPWIESRVIEKIGIEIGGKLHSGRSRNDQVNLDMRLLFRTQLLYLIEEMIAFSRVLLEKAKTYDSLPAPLFTHLQPAQVGLLGHYFLYYASVNIRSIDRLIESFHRLNQNPLGACAIGGTSFPIDRRLTTRLLGFDGLIINSLDAISARDIFLELARDLEIIAISFSRIAEDFIIFSSPGYAFVELDDAHASVSSVLPQKKNPDTLELIKGKTGFISGQAVRISTIVKGTPSGYNRDFQEIKPALIDAFDSILQEVKILSAVTQNLRVNEDCLNTQLKLGKLNALDVAEYLVQVGDISFREAHICIGSLIREKPTAPLSESLSKNSITSKIWQLFEKKFEPPDAEFESLFDFHKCLLRRKSEGSPRPDFLHSQISDLTGILDKRASLSVKLSQKINQTTTRLESIIRAILSGDQDQLFRILKQFTSE